MIGWVSLAEERRMTQEGPECGGGGWENCPLQGAPTAVWPRPAQVLTFLIMKLLIIFQMINQICLPLH